MECIFKEMPRSAKHVGVRERDCQHRCWEKKDHSPLWAPTTSHATAFEQISSGNDHQLIRSLVEEVYQGHLVIGQCWLTANKLRSLSDEIKDKMRTCIWTCRSAHASSSSLEAVGPLVRSSARFSSRTESMAACSTSQVCSTNRWLGPSRGHWLPKQRRSPSRPWHWCESQGHCLRDGGATLQTKEVPVMKSQSPTIRKVVWRKAGAVPGAPIWGSGRFPMPGANRLTSSEKMSTREKDGLPGERVETSWRRGPPNVGWVPSLSNHILAHQLILLTVIGNPLSQLLLFHSWLYKRLNQTQWRSPANG